jgi:integrase
MARTRNRLSAIKVSGCKDPGYYADGGNLYLKVGPTGAKSWIFRFTREKRTRDAGLGPYPTVSLVRARERADDYRRLVSAGIDPIEARDEERKNKAPPALSFRACAEAYLVNQEAGWRNPKHRDQWHSTLKTYVYPLLGSLPVDTVTTDHVLQVLEPIWSKKPETASRVRGRIEAVLNSAKARGLRSGENPAQWRGHLDHLLPAKGKVRRVKHHAAMPYKQVPAFMKALRQNSSVSARCLEFTILTCARTSEALGAQWSEIDFDNKLWTVPADRMKAGKIHRVPLSSRAIAILKEMKAVKRNEFVFASWKPGRPLSQMTLAMIVRRMGHTVTVHGFRSSFKDWASEETKFSREVSEMALAHSIPDAVEAAYRRGELLEQRRKLTKQWEQFSGSASSP